MKFLLLAFMSCSLLAVDELHFFDLNLEYQKDDIHLRVESQPLFPYEFIRDHRYLLNDTNYDHLFDGPLRQVAFLMRTLERNRGVIMKSKNPEPLPILNFKFRLNLRQESGAIIESDKYEVLVELSTESNQFTIRCDTWGTKKSFAINTLTQPEAYRDFIEYLVLPAEERVLKRPAGTGFVVELLYRWPDVVIDYKDVKLFDLFPSFLLWDKGIANRVRRHVATAYGYREEGGWQTVSSAQARVFSQSINRFTHVLETETKGDLKAYVIALEEYIDKVPSDRRGLKRLMDAYLEAEMDIEAYGLISRYQPFFATIREGLDNQEELAKRATQKRNFLLGRLGQFRKDPGTIVAITSPEDGDLVTGRTQLQFSIAANKADLLLVDAYLGEQRIARLREPPFSLPFTVDDLSPRETELRVIAYFEDETFQEHDITVKVLNVDEQQRVNLVPLRASLLNIKDSGGIAKKDFFKITENGERMQIEHFRKNDAPLRIAFILDTSGSMMGDKIFATQFAIKSFLEKLQPDDRAAVYTFDDRVLKISDFSNNFGDLSRQLMTLYPKGSTSLYDAMLIAHDALLGENGTKVLIVMSDGDDSASSTTDIHVASVLRYSPVMVYSVILTGGQDHHNARKAKQFLKEMARMTGSTHTTVRNPENLREIFDEIYQDLRSFYYLDFYSQLTDPSQRKIEVRYKGGGRLRYRVLR